MQLLNQNAQEKKMYGTSIYIVTLKENFERFDSFHLNSSYQSLTIYLLYCRSTLCDQIYVYKIEFRWYLFCTNGKIFLSSEYLISQFLDHQRFRVYLISLASSSSMAHYMHIIQTIHLNEYFNKCLLFVITCSLTQPSHQFRIVLLCVQSHSGIEYL